MLRIIRRLTRRGRGNPAVGATETVQDLYLGRTDPTAFSTPPADTTTSITYDPQASARDDPTASR